MNVWSFIGTVGKKGAEIKAANGKQFLTFSVAVDSGYGQKKVTTWVGCTLWGDRGAKLAEYIKAGDKIGVTGEHGTREYENKVYTTCNVQNVTLIGGKREESASAPKPKNPGIAPASRYEDDEVPF